MRAKKPIAPQLLAEGKHLYEKTSTPVALIATRLGLAPSTLRLRVKEWGWVRSSSRGDAARVKTPAAFDEVSRQDQFIAQDEMTIDMPQPTEESSAMAEISSDTPCDERAALYARVIQAAKTQMNAIERLQKTLRSGDAMKAERTTRLMATLNKMLKEVAAIAKPDRVTPHHETDHDAIPRDIDEFREALARQIEGLIETERRRAGESSAENQ